MKMKKTIVLVLIAVLLLIVFYFGFRYLQPEDIIVTETTIGNVEVPEPTEANVSMVVAYWGDIEEPATENETCSNETKDSNLTFVVEFNTAINAVNYDECYIVNNEEKIDTTIIEMKDTFGAIAGVAETDRENNVKACCMFENVEYCSGEDKLYLCEVQLTEE